MSKTDLGISPDTIRTGKSLKDQNRWQLWLILAANSVFLYGIFQTNAIRVDGLRALFTDAHNLLPVGFALTVTTVLNGVLSVQMKNRLVFLRWNSALPGHRAFSVYAKADPRIDLSSLPRLCNGAVPINPTDQNSMWYSIYKTMENDPAVRQVHRDFLLLRDYTGISTLFIVCYGPIGLYAIPSMRIGLTYIMILLLQYLFVRQGASNYGIEFVTTVLARKGGLPMKTGRKKRQKNLPDDPGESHAARD